MPVLAVTKTFALVYMVSMSLIACFRSSDLPAEVLNDLKEERLNYLNICTKYQLFFSRLQKGTSKQRS
jgi:hypothetical protein